MGRRAHLPDPALRRQVEAMAAYGIPEDDIARVVGIDPKTLRKHYRDELDLGQTKANAQVAGFLFNSARNGNVSAQIFWLKTRASWKETPSEHRHVAAIGTFDVREMSDEELERIVFGAPVNLGPMPRAQRREVLAPGPSWKGLAMQSSRTGPMARPADVSADSKAADQRAAALEIVRREATRSGRTVRSILSVVRMVSRRVSRNGSCLHPSGCFDPRT